MKFRTLALVAAAALTTAVTGASAETVRHYDNYQTARANGNGAAWVARHRRHVYRHRVAMRRWDAVHRHYIMSYYY